jgi:hypothetical protein
METQDYSSDLMDYLYGEMTAAQKAEFEAKMNSNEMLRKEFEELKAMREELSILDEKQVMEPSGIWNSSPSGWVGSRRSQSRFISRPITAIAAAIALLMVVGYLTDFSLTVNQQGLQVGFNTSESLITQPSVAMEDIKLLVAREIEKANAGINDQLTSSRENMDVRLSSLEKAIENPENANKDLVSRVELSRFMAGIEQQNTELLQQYLNQASSQQQEYFKTMLTQFNDYLQEQRAEDINMLKAGLMEIQYNQTQQKIETENALTNLFTTVSNR